jgi:hypothetical protein
MADVISRLADPRIAAGRSVLGERQDYTGRHPFNHERGMESAFPRTPDFWESRAERKTRLYATAKRWAQRLPGEKGEDHARTYRRMIEAFLGALRT